jgi:hypothetical protein
MYVNQHVNISYVSMNVLLTQYVCVHELFDESLYGIDYVSMYALWVYAQYFSSRVHNVSIYGEKGIG